jgi:hypothetical protein
MVGSIGGFPGATQIGANPLARESNLREIGAGRTALAPSGAQGAPMRDSVSLTPGANQDGAREQLLAARAGLDLAIAAGRQVLGVLGDMGDVAARAARPDAPDEARLMQDQSLRALGARLAEIIDGAIAAGARSLAGEETEAGPGLDMRPGAPAGAISWTPDAGLTTEEGARATAAALRESFGKVSAGLVRLQEAASGFDVHLNALSALDKSVSGRVTSLEEDSARMMALQVRQTLAGLDQPIVNAGGGLLSHFKV